MESAKDYQIVLVTVDSHETALNISNVLISDSFAACVNILPGITSVYQWQSQVEKSTECLMVIKTKASSLEELEKKILELHPYDCPEIISFEMSSGHLPYLNWIDKNTKTDR